MTFQRSTDGRQFARILVWLMTGFAGVGCALCLAWYRNERPGALWLVGCSLCVYAIAYRFYGRFIAHSILRIDDSCQTPARAKADGVDYVPTHRFVLFGHHFAAIAGAGPLVGPVLAAQMGYLPGTLWILAGVVFAGAVQDLVALFLAVRGGGVSLGNLIGNQLGRTAGIVATAATFVIMTIILAVLAMIVVKALAQSPWGLVTVLATIPLALFMGVYTRWLRPGRIGEATVIGIAGLFAALVVGGLVSRSPELAPLFSQSPTHLCFGLIVYGAAASLSPVWLLLVPRDFLSTFLKLGVILALALAILVLNPVLRLPALTTFAESGGPVWSGGLYPFLFITIACGAVSGFHALIATGSTPRMIDKESDILPIGYGAMLTESFVAIMALICAATLDPGLYFVMNAPAAAIGGDPIAASAAITSLGFPISPASIVDAAHAVGEQTLMSRTGGAPTLAVAMSDLFSRVVGGSGFKAFWYHFAILFEALFILTAVDAGTRACRFIVQGFFDRAGRHQTFISAAVATAICVSGWGYFLYQGVTDPLGGVNTLWPVFGIANQILACIALIYCACTLWMRGRRSLTAIAAVPAAFLLATTATAALLKLASPDPAVGFLSHAMMLTHRLASVAPHVSAATESTLPVLIRNDFVDAGVCALLLGLLLTIAALGLRSVCVTSRISNLKRPLASADPSIGV